MMYSDAAVLSEDFLTRGVMWRRVVAWLIDVVFIGLLCAVLWLLFLALGVATLGLALPLFGVMPAVPLLYHWLGISRARSATPGQAMLGLAVRRNLDLGRPDAVEALVFTVLLWVTLALGAIWLLVALVTPRHRAVHDMISGLVVVRADKLTRATLSWNMDRDSIPGR